MAYENLGIDITRRSSGDMSSYQYHIVTFSTTNDDDGCILSTAGAYGHGVWQGPTSTVAEYGQVRVLGLTKLWAGSSDTASPVGTFLVPGVAGHALPSTSGTVNPKVMAIALEGLTTGTTGIIEAFVIPMGGGSTST